MISSKLKILCLKGHHQENEKITHSMEENIYKSCISQETVTKIYKILLQVDIEKTSKPILKWTKD